VATNWVSIAEAGQHVAAMSVRWWDGGSPFWSSRLTSNVVVETRWLLSMAPSPILGITTVVEEKVPEHCATLEQLIAQAHPAR
jgi:hypothetical protein